jgi:hypothetical protein
MKVAVQIIGWHPCWEKITSIIAIRISAGCGLTDAKHIVDRALTGGFAEFEVEGLVEAARVAQELADLGAVIYSDGVTYDSFHGDERGIPYRKAAIGTMIAEGAESDGVFSGKLITGTAVEQFDLSVPMNGSLDFRVGARLLSQAGDRIKFTVNCGDDQERYFWQEMFADTDTEADIHKPEQPHIDPNA